MEKSNCEMLYSYSERWCTFIRCTWKSVQDTLSEKSSCRSLSLSLFLFLLSQLYHPFPHTYTHVHTCIHTHTVEKSEKIESKLWGKEQISRGRRRGGDKDPLLFTLHTSGLFQLFFNKHVFRNWRKETVYKKAKRSELWFSNYSSKVPCLPTWIRSLKLLFIFWEAANVILVYITKHEVRRVE